MKNLRYKAFHKPSKTMGIVTLIDFENETVDVSLTNIFDTWIFNDIELLQYAGKLGHSETPLFEGDIVHVKVNKHGLPIGNGHKAYIKFNSYHSQWQYCYLTIADYWGTNDIKGEFLTYLGGNIHENPELLNA